MSAVKYDLNITIEKLEAAYCDLNDKFNLLGPKAIEAWEAIDKALDELKGEG